MTPQQEAIIISKSAQAVPTRAIGQELGVSHTTIERRQKRLRELINKEAAELLNRGLIPARRTITRLAAMGNSKDADKDQLRIALDASKVILNAGGILANAGTTINNLIQINNNEMPEVIKQLFSAITHADHAQGNISLMDDSVIDVGE
jgi:hypothetical protein